MKRASITKDAIKRVAGHVGLSLEFIDQDWHVTMARSADINQLIHYYDSFGQSEDKSVLMWFILAAYNSYLHACENKNQKPDSNLEKSVVGHLCDNWRGHEDAVGYWSLFDYDDGIPVSESDAFFISPLMRRLWREHNKQS